MSEYLIMFLMVILFPGIIISIIFFWLFIGEVLNKIIGLPEIHPYCDIDPKCHPEYFEKDGKGYIRNKKVYG